MNLELPDAPEARFKYLVAYLIAELAGAVTALEQRANGVPETPRTSETWIPTAEAAARLGVTRQTLLRYKAKGMLKTARIGRSDRYSTRELDALPEIIQKGQWRAGRWK